MDQASIDRLFYSLTHTEVTKTAHTSVYPAISPTKPSLSQAGNTILVTGGGTGVGFAIARAFVQASASMVIVIGRRSSILHSATISLESEAQEKGTNTKISARVCDVSDDEQVRKLWENLGVEGINVDVFISNAAVFTDMKPLVELGVDYIWKQMDVNARSPLVFAEKFYKQGVKGKQKFLINLTSAVIHMGIHPEAINRPTYQLNKMTGTYIFQLLASDIPANEMQIITIHPGIIYQDSWKSYGFLPGPPFDSAELPGSFAVWAASKEAGFLHGRFVWASWDVEELAGGELRERIDSDHEFLRCTISGASAGLVNP